MYPKLLVKNDFLSGESRNVRPARSKIDPPLFLHESKAEVILGNSAKPIFDFHPSPSRYKPPKSGWSGFFALLIYALDFFHVSGNISTVIQCSD